MSRDVMDVLGDMCDAAQQTTLGSGGGCPLPPKQEFHLELVSHDAEAGKNEYGSFVKAQIGFRCIEPGEFEDREWLQTYFINKTKDGKLSGGGQSYVKLANVLGGEEIEGNNPQEAKAVIEGSIGSAVRVKTWENNKGYTQLDPLSLADAPEDDEEDINDPDFEAEVEADDEVPATRTPAKKPAAKRSRK